MCFVPLVRAEFIFVFFFCSFHLSNTSTMANGGGGGGGGGCEKLHAKMCGYLEKKGKLKMMSSWKSYWFVLEGRLLLYYRSKDEYEALSPFKGSINLGPSCTVEPLLGTSCVFQIQTRANTIILKARTRLEQQKWMHAIVVAIDYNHNYSTKKMIHFRYSSDDLVPRRPALEKKSCLSRQHTLPWNHLKVEKRHTICRSFETLQSDAQKRPKSTIVPKNNHPPSAMVENAEYCGRGPNPSVMVENAEYCGRNRNPSVMVENAEYCSRDRNPTVIIDNTIYCSQDRLSSIMKENSEYAKAVADRISRKLEETTSSSKTSLDPKAPHLDVPFREEYYAISAPTEEEREFLRKKSQEKNEHIYERISGESRLSTASKDVSQDNDLYATACEVKSLRKRSNSDGDDVSVDNDIYYRKSKDGDGNEAEAFVENDQYCTPDIVIGDTDLVSYHEYNLPNRDNHIYSTPNFDHNDNRISREREGDVNPYAMCHIYPKSRMSVEWSSSRDSDVLYDDPMELNINSASSEPTKNVGGLLRKLRKFSNSSDTEKRQHVPKKTSFLKKLFGLGQEKKALPRPQPQPEVQQRPPSLWESGEEDEIEYDEVDEEVINKMDMAYCIDKRLLAELEVILQLKRKKLEEYLGVPLSPTKHADDGITSSKFDEQATISGATTRPKIPLKPAKTPSTEDDRYKNLKTIDEILDDLEEMKRTKCVTSGKVRCLIEKFDETVKKSATTLRKSKESLKDEAVILRSKREKSRDRRVGGSNDELNVLLCELAKVANAPILKPGATCSLGATSSAKDVEFLNLIPKSQRRHSEPDYDIPRPHTNLKITKIENADDALTATRFFGPAMPNYDNRHTEAPSPFAISISPDSLESETAGAAQNDTELSMASYSSHKYERCRLRRQMGKEMEDEEAEVFIDSLEPHNRD